jgi:hypothetical protein
MAEAEYVCSGSVPASQYIHYGLASDMYTHFTYVPQLSLDSVLPFDPRAPVLLSAAMPILSCTGFSLMLLRIRLSKHGRWPKFTRSRRTSTNGTTPHAVLRRTRCGSFKCCTSRNATLWRKQSYTQSAQMHCLSKFPSAYCNPFAIAALRLTVAQQVHDEGHGILEGPRRQILCGRHDWS